MFLWMHGETSGKDYGFRVFLFAKQVLDSLSCGGDGPRGSRWNTSYMTPEPAIAENSGYNGMLLLFLAHVK